MLGGANEQCKFDGQIDKRPRRKLSERWGWSRGKTKKFLNLLKDENMIEFKTDHQKTTYKIVNYNVYQNEDLDKRATE